MSESPYTKSMNRTLPKLSVLEQIFKPPFVSSIFADNTITIPQKQPHQTRKMRFTSHYLELQLCLKVQRKKKQIKSWETPKLAISISPHPEEKQMIGSKPRNNQIKLVSLEREIQRQKFIEKMSTILESVDPAQKQGYGYIVCQKPRHNRLTPNKSVELRADYSTDVLNNPEIGLFDNRKAAITIPDRAASKFKKPNKAHYRAYFGSGNNSSLVRSIVLSRKGWTETIEHDTIFNLRWQQSTEKTWYERIDFVRFRQSVNHLGMHEEISSKAGLLQSLQKFCTRRNLNMFDIVPVSFVLDWNYPNKLEEELKKFVFYYCENNPNGRFAKKEREYIEMVRSLSDSETKLSNFSFNKCKGPSAPPLNSVYLSDNSKYVWMLKPSDFNRGRGIKIWCTLEELTEILSKAKQQKRLLDSYVIQKYIQRPLLIKGRKFDIRVWSLIDNFGSVYFFEEGYIRTSCEQYQLENLDDIYIHLTNNAIQIKNEKYGKFQKANQLSYDDFDQVLPDIGPFRQTILPKIKEMSSLTIQSGMKKIFPKWNNNKCGFQIFGLDFMLDYNCKPWLIEVNTNPCLETTSQILESLLPRMLDDAFKIVLDPIYPGSKAEKPYPVAGYEDTTNLWKPLPNNYK